MHAYCLFCDTTRCETIAHVIQTFHHIRAISPRLIQRIWIKGKPTEQAVPWLPGYIFLYSEDPIIPNFPVDGIIRWLDNDELQGQDLVFAETLLEQNGVMGSIRLAEEGDRCVVADPIWENLQGTIVKIDRGRRRCCVSFEFAHTSRTVWVGYDMVKRTDAD